MIGGRIAAAIVSWPAPDFARRRVDQERDVPYGLLEFIERHFAALEQPPAIHRGLDALRPAIEQPRTKRMFGLPSC
jgi:hypothetical protein